MKEKHIIEIHSDVRIDTRMIIDRKIIRHFAINVAIIQENGDTEDVFRVDTAHKGLHKMRFWISAEPEYIEKTRKENYTNDFNEWAKIVDENFASWAKTYKRKKGLS